MINSKVTFTYGGYHFTPVRQLRKKEDFFTVSRRLSSDRHMGMSTYGWKKVNYSHQTFYDASSDKECDIFRCEENSKLYIPGQNELFIYNELQP